MGEVGPAGGHVPPAEDLVVAAPRLEDVGRRRVAVLQTLTGPGHGPEVEEQGERVTTVGRNGQDGPAPWDVRDGPGRVPVVLVTFVAWTDGRWSTDVSVSPGESLEPVRVAHVRLADAHSGVSDEEGTRRHPTQGPP